MGRRLAQCWARTHETPQGTRQTDRFAFHITQQGGGDPRPRWGPRPNRARTRDALSDGTERAPETYALRHCPKRRRHDDARRAMCLTGLSGGRRAKRVGGIPSPPARRDAFPPGLTFPGAPRPNGRRLPGSRIAATSRPATSGPAGSQTPVVTPHGGSTRQKRARTRTGTGREYRLQEGADGIRLGRASYGRTFPKRHLIIP